MAIVDVNEIWNGRDGVNETGGREGEGAIRRYKRVFRVQTDNQLDGPQVVMADRRIPKLTDIYKTTKSTDTGALCHRIHAVIDQGDWKYWLVTCEYSSDADDTGDPAFELHRGGKGGRKSKDQKDPTKEPMKIHVGSERYVRRCDLDVFGRKVMTSTAEPFDPPIEVEDIRPVIRLTKNVEDFVIADPLNVSRINSDVFLGYPPGAVRQTGIAATEHYENGKHYWTVTREFTVDIVNFWTLAILSFGFREKDDDGKLVEITLKGTTKNGEPLHPSEWKVNDPHPLDEHGKKATSPYVIRFKPYQSMSFAPFAPTKEDLEANNLQ